MTVVLTLKVQDGVVLAADGALAVDDAETNATHYIYSHATKLFKLHKTLPLGLLSLGIGNIGAVSIETLIKDLRRKFMEPGEYYIDPIKYSLKLIAAHIKSYVYKFYCSDMITFTSKPALQFLLTGYEKDDLVARQYGIVIQGSTDEPPMELEDRYGLWSGGMPEAIRRLYDGYSQKLASNLRTLLPASINIDQLMLELQPRLQAQIISQEMPINDAVDLSLFLMNTAINYQRFMPGPHKVGGRISVAIITKHKFKWIKKAECII